MEAIEPVMVGKVDCADDAVICILVRGKIADAAMNRDGSDQFSHQMIN